eukprot:SAG22_NODE_487_length_9870_cov_13.118821_14_plen_240_part_00
MHAVPGHGHPGAGGGPGTPARPPPTAAAGMVLVTSGQSALGQAIAAELGRAAAGAGAVRTTDRGDDCPLSHDEATDALLASEDTVVYVEPALLGSAAVAADDQWCDIATRVTYNVLTAAVAAGVRHVLMVSSLEVLANHDHDLAFVRPSWQPRPTTAPGSLGPHLAEFMGRQFAFAAVRGADVTPAPPLRRPCAPALPAASPLRLSLPPALRPPPPPPPPPCIALGCIGGSRVAHAVTL